MILRICSILGVIELFSIALDIFSSLVKSRIEFDSCYFGISMGASGLRIDLSRKAISTA